MSSEGLAALKIDRTRARRNWSVWPWLLLIVAVALVAAVAPGFAKQFQVAEVSVTKAVKASVAKNPKAEVAELSAAGYVVADRQSTLAAKITGRLIKLTVRESQHIKKDELVAELEHKDLDALIRQSEAEHNEAVADIERLRKVADQMESEVVASKAPLKTLDAENEQYKIMLADAQRRLERAKKVVEKNAMPFSEVEDRITEVKATDAKIAWTDERKREAERKILVTESQLSVARSAIAVAEAREKTMAARIEVLRKQLLDYFVNAPFDGVVTEKAAELGEIIAPISIGGTMARGSIITLADWNSLQAEVDVAETQIAKVKAGGRAAITVDAFPGKTFPGKVLRILPRANRSKATVQVRVDFLQRDQGILPEMGVRVKFVPDDAPAGIETGEIKDNIVVPKSALLGVAGSNFVWVISDSMARKRVVTAGELSGDNVEITSGLASGDIVVTRGADKILEDNQKVRVAE